VRVYQFRHIRVERQSSRSSRRQIGHGGRTIWGIPAVIPVAEETIVGLEKREKGRRSTVFGVIGVVWGGLIIGSMLLHGLPSATNSYDAGRLGAFVFAFALVGAGVWELRKS
jgi:hypothetical protein